MRLSIRLKIEEKLPKPKREKKALLSDEEWELRFQKHVNPFYYSGERISAGSNATTLARISSNPTGGHALRAWRPKRRKKQKELQESPK